MNWEMASRKSECRLTQANVLAIELMPY